MRRNRLTAAFLLLLAVALVPDAGAAATCTSLRSLELPGTTITLAEAVPAGGFRTGEPEFKDLPAFCRVAGVIRPTTESDIQFEVWMPLAGWNHKFQGVGNGGFAGSIEYGELAAAVRQGFAAASTNTGHNGTAVDAQWALGHPQKIVDFGYRGIHLTAITAKAIAKAFYGVPARYTYFASCSNGGRQALMEAQRFPSDYNGIIAGAPANNWTVLLSSAVWGAQATLENPASYIPAGKLPAISKAVLAACGREDGVPEGYVSDPPKCHFNPKTLLCRGADSANCLTAPQVAALEKIYSGPRTSVGKHIFPGFEPGGELGQNGWEGWITGSAPRKSLGFVFGTQFFSNMVFNNPEWDFRTFNFDTGVEAVDRKFGSILNATNPNLSAFRARGGKLIMYHGWSDAAIPPLSTVNYYERVIAAMGSRPARSFVRLFMVPGMQHCSDGPGPSSFGAYEAAAPFDAADNMFDALEDWVEHGTAPQKIIATRYRKSSDPKSGVEITRPLCSYPLVANYKGSGSTKIAASFACALSPPVRN